MESWWRFVIAERLNALDRGAGCQIGAVGLELKVFALAGSHKHLSVLKALGLRAQVRVVASLPCYSSDNVDAQRGSGVFQRSIQGLQMLNTAGYGCPGSRLQLDLVYNPNGAFLAPPQHQLEARAHVASP